MIPASKPHVAGFNGCGCLKLAQLPKNRDLVAQAFNDGIYITISQYSNNFSTECSTEHFL